MKKITKLTVVMTAALCMALLVATASFAATVTDIAGHWAESYIEYGIEAGYISGYADGTFLPDKTVTRAEFSKMINNAVKLTSAGDAKGDFNDVVSKDWFFEEVKKAENAGYINGYEDGSFRPNNTVTRQEAAVILSRIVLPVEERANVDSFGDGASIDNWAKDSVSMIAAKGYIKGDDKGNFNPKGALTRSQAAKLICEFVKNENIVNRNQNVVASDDEVVYSETLFTDDIVIDLEDAEDLTVVFKNCRVLGNVYVKTEDVSVKLENASIKNLCVQDDGVVVNADRSSEVKNAIVEEPATLKGDNFKKVVLRGDDLSSATVKLAGEFASVAVEGDAFISAETIKQLDITKKVSVAVQTGTVEKLDVAASAKDSTINLASKVTVDKANNKAVVSYVGSGTVKEANNEVTGVKYDGVTVEKTTGKVAEGAGNGTTSENFFKDVEVSPANKKTNVSISAKLYLTFLSEVFDDKGDKLTVAYIEDNFELRKGSADGTKVAFEATVASSNKKITIAPVANYKGSTSYYLVIPKGTLTYEDGTENDKYVTYFKTAAAGDDGESESSGSDDDDESGVTMSPKNGADDVSVNTSIKLTFDGTLKAYSGTLDESYIEDEAIEIHEGSKTGDTVRFSATISGKTITLVPSRLLGKTDYYVVILGNKLKVGGNTLSKTTMSFTTEEGTPITISPENGATGVSTLPEITVSFAEPMFQMTRDHDELTETYIQDEVLYIKKGSTKDSADDVYYSVKEIAENNRSFVIVPDEELESGTTYYIIIQEGSLYGEETENENDKVTSNFKTAAAMAPMFYPLDGKENVSLGTEIRISFSGELLTYAKDKADRVEVDDTYLDELINGYENSKGKVEGKNRISLKRTGSSKPLTITASLDSDGKTIIITPETALLEEKEYTISIEKNLFYSLSDDGKTYKANTAGSAKFNTNIAMAPTMTPKNDAEGIAVTVNPTIKFSEAIFNADGKELKSTYLKNNAITFVDADGEEVEFKVSVSGSTITVEPEEDLEGNTEYTLTLVAGTITNEDGIANAEKSVTFTTKVSYTIDITPATNGKNVSPFVNPTVKFGTPVLTADGDAVDSEYAAEYIFLTEKSASKNPDDAIEATIEVSADGRTFTIVPDSELDFNTKYYVNVLAKGFLYEDEDTENKVASAYFTTIKEPEIDSSTKKTYAKAGGKTSIKITYVSNVMDDSDDELAILVVEDEGGNEVLTKPITTTSSATVTVKSLESDTDYTFYIYIRYADQIESEKVEVSAKTN